VENLRAAISAAVHRADVREAVDGVYAELQRAIDKRRPLCVVSGRCCRFEEYGHRLYVTTLELARFMMDLGARPRADWNGRGCPFQASTLCGVHAIRPFGCRIFFCDASSTAWQQELYEQLHARLRHLHDELGVAYYYLEWRQGLIAAGLIASPETGKG
jgi:Fe-S-cluster containining protein